MLRAVSNWKPPSDWQRITAVDVRTEGEPLRVIVDGFPELKGKSILERRRYLHHNFDNLRTSLMWEPRGHADMYGCLITPAVTPEADFGVLFMHNEGYSTMCGHGIIGVVKAALELGMISMQTPETEVHIDTPAGLVSAYARVEQGSVESIYFHNVPSFVLGLDETVKVPGLGKINYDLAFGGAFYAFVNVEDVGLVCSRSHLGELIETGMAVKRAVMRSRAIAHPFESDLNFLYGTIFIGPPQHEGSHSRNVCIFAEGEVDRSPTGTGVSARMAIHHMRGDLRPQQKVVIESIIGTRFTASVQETTRYGPYAAVVPEIEGRAFITGRHEFFLDPADPLRNGFMLR